MKTFVRLAAIILVLRIASPAILTSLEELILEMMDFMMAVLQQAGI